MRPTPNHHGAPRGLAIAISYRPLARIRVVRRNTPKQTSRLPDCLPIRTHRARPRGDHRGGRNRHSEHREPGLSCANGGGACAVCAREWDGAWCCEKNAFDSQLIIRLLGRAVFRTWALPRVRVPTAENRNTMQRLAKGEMKGDLGILALPAKSGNLDSLAGVALGARNAVPNYHRPVLGPRCLAQLPSRCSASQFP